MYIEEINELLKSGEENIGIFYWRKGKFYL